MNATVTESKNIKEGRWHHYHGNKAVVYVDERLSDQIDKDLFDRIIPLNFKSKAWSWICKKANNFILNAVKQVFPENYDIKYSTKAGCQCGCSPGYIVKRHGDYKQPFLTHNSVWVDVDITDQEIENFKHETYERFETMLEDEIAENALQTSGELTAV
jgi:hypothetical protein